jgi:sterol carrier protein 2
MPRKFNTQPCYVLGVGMTKFIKPRGKVDYTELGFEAGVKAMLDAQINYDDVDQGGLCSHAIGLHSETHLFPQGLVH